MGFSLETDRLVELAAREEYLEATRRWGQYFNSAHEGWAVLKEELEEEVEESVENVKRVKEDLRALWTAIRDDDMDEAKGKASSCHGDALDAMRNLAQVAAVCRKIRCTIDKEDK